MQDFDRQFGWIECPDARDALFPMSTVLPQIPAGVTEKYWWDDGWWGDQGNSSHCVAYSWLHYIADGPVVQKGRFPAPLIEPNRFYKECQLRDPWAGEAYAGTSIRAGALVLKDLGVISEYRWASNINEIVTALLTIGPVVVGTKWYGDMMNPKNGMLKLSGRDMGGHAYILNGVDTKKRSIQIKNSWGKYWGDNGRGYISFDDFERLFRNGGEACISFENILTEELNWSKLRSPGVYR